MWMYFFSLDSFLILKETQGMGSWGSSMSLLESLDQCSCYLQDHTKFLRSTEQEAADLEEP